MSYPIYMLAALSAIEWSQVTWRLEEAPDAGTAECEQEMIHDVLLRHLPRQGLSVDAGCGTGKWPIYLARRGYRVIGLDISLEAGRTAKATDRDVSMTVGDVRQIPLRDRSLDAVISLGVVEHDERGPLEALHEARRVLKPDGILVLSVPYNNPFRRLVVNRLQTYVTWKRRRAGVKLGFLEYRFSKREVRRFLAETGFEPLAAYPNDFLPPRNVGLWVDHQNLVFNPLHEHVPGELFRLPGLAGRVAVAVTRHAPWLVCGEVAFVARAC